MSIVGNASVDVEVTANNTASIPTAEFTNNRNYVQVSKVDAASNEELKGATIQVLRELVDGEITSDTTFSIDQTGKVTATGSTTTDENGNEVLLIKDNKTHIEVSKVDIADGEELEGATIQILRKLDENEVKSGEKTYVTINEIEYEVVEEWVSEKNKTHVVEGLLTGTEYTLHEEVAPDGYLVTSGMKTETKSC